MLWERSRGRRSGRIIKSCYLKSPSPFWVSRGIFLVIPQFLFRSICSRLYVSIFYSVVPHKRIITITHARLLKRSFYNIDRFTSWVQNAYLLKLFNWK
jgi:hypothetical protein